MKAIERVLNTDCLTVTGKTVKENLESYRFLFPRGSECHPRLGRCL